MGECSCRVNKLCIFGAALILSYAGWMAAEPLGLGFFGAFMLSGAGALAGVYLGWKIARRLD